MKSILLIIICFIAYSCQKKEIKNPSSETKEVITYKKTEEHKNKQVNDTILMNFKNEKDTYTAEGTIDSIQNKIYLKFKNEFPAKLSAKITPSANKATANIRFNQIIFPDKTADGPFGTELKTNIKQSGSYILVIGHSQMAENPYIGKLKVELQIEKNN